MIVVCLTDCYKEPVLLLPTQVNTPIDDENFVVVMGYTVDSQITEYHITKNVEYTVYGFFVYRNQIRYLIQDNDGIPVFCPKELFSVKKPDVYWDWEVASYSIEDKSLLLIGYPAMCGGYEELIDLISRKENAIKRFLKYKDFYNNYQI